MKNLADNLNAEPVLGTVTNVKEGARWLGVLPARAHAQEPPRVRAELGRCELDPSSLNREHPAKPRGSF